MTQDQLDDQCARWGHRDRKVAFCPNPLCPGKLPSELVDSDEVPDVTDELLRVPDTQQPAPVRDPR